MEMAKVASSQWLSESMRPLPFQCFIISLDRGYVPEKLWKLYIIDKKSISQLEDYTSICLDTEQYPETAVNQRERTGQ